MLAALRGHDAPVTGVVSSADGHRAVSSSSTSRNRLLDDRRREKLRTTLLVPGQCVITVLGSLAAREPWIRTHPVVKTRLRQIYPRWAPGAGSWDQSVILWHLPSRQQLARFTDHGRQVSCVAGDENLRSYCTANSPAADSSWRY